MSQAEEPKKPSDPKPNALPPPCKGGCGFFGTAQYNEYCSVCFKGLPQDQKDEILNTKAKSNDNTKTEEKEDNNATTNDDKPKKKVQKKKNRCWQCRKKITLAGRFECKCGYVYCSQHRFADAHACDFDYQQEHKKNLEKQNAVVAPSKFNKI